MGRLTESRARSNKVFSMLDAKRGESLLLLGEREGLLASLLTGETGVEITWCEPSFQPTEGTEARTTRLEGPVSRVVGDYGWLPYSDGSFDAVSAQFTLEYVEEPAAALSEWVRVLKPGGRLVLVIKNPLFKGYELMPRPGPLHSFSLESVGILTAKAGLEVSRMTTLFPNLLLPSLCKASIPYYRIFESIPYLSSRGRLLLIDARREI
jgi:SAM-dependent methyltransferase